ncbi:MAG: hypothetical protein F6K42_18890 [Leptolyngbya sp. SIO1D8]|nr:hypothetical protein [Leptolyngbya sp. SIO1D8]
MDPDTNRTQSGQGLGQMMNKSQKAARKRPSKGFAEDVDGAAGHNQDGVQDMTQDKPGHEPGHHDKLPIWMGQVQEIVRTKDRSEGEYSASAIAEVCGVDDSTIRNRWLKSINSEIANESALRAENGRYTELAMELLAHMAACRDAGFGPAEWVLQVLRPALSSMPSQQVAPNEYQTALTRREQANEEQSKAMEIRWAEMKQRRQGEAETRQRLTDADLERIRLEEKSKILAEVEERDRIRRELLAELGLL